MYCGLRRAQLGAEVARADQYRGSSLQRRILEALSSRVQLRKLLQEKLLGTIEGVRRVKKAHVLVAWKSFRVNALRIKEWMYLALETAGRKYSTMRLELSMHRWQELIHQSKQRQLSIALSNHHFRVMIKDRALWVWVQTVAERRHHEGIAIDHWRRWSLEAFLSSWRRELSGSKIKEALRLTLLVFTHWHEHILTLHQVQQMRDRCRRRLVEKAWMVYRKHLARGRWLVEVLRVAAVRAEFRWLRTRFGAWSNFLAAKRRRKNVCRHALAAFRYGILRIAMGHWKNLVQLKHWLEHMDAEARQQYKASLQRRALREWLAVIPKLLHLRALVATATQRHKLVLQGRVLQLWCKRIQQLAAWKHLRGTALSRGWRSWRTYVFKCRRLVNLSMQVVCTWVTGITGRALNSWTSFVRFNREMRQLQLVVNEVMQQFHMRQTVHRWLSAVMYLQNLRYKKQLAESHARRRVLSTAMHQMFWERVWNHQKLAMAEDHAYVHRLSRLFTGWMRATSHCLHRRETLFKQVSPHLRATLRRISSV
ncbi:hypothetical protein CYMTET_32199 [Cymbomonas tetramitiformis]|uniref:Sfi1 spindle body domain-containing protein n=1 Tax=Cymbomonas tetramitiformis TaxID=36881 RepID=A0AAE0KSG9_9CHLO|nr:hypothetical protein CYMTET_32199 [Cymbomonas tetramitiformis]